MNNILMGMVIFPILMLIGIAFLVGSFASGNFGLLIFALPITGLGFFGWINTCTGDWNFD